ncbi:MAG: HisA/HisF-related TIM barrel protein [Holophaga sp.]|nr:HisA/HisF-related TIM barrel protein [Holophaga sp.]
MRLIPSMDLLGGQVVRLLKGERASAFVYAFTPEAWVERLVEAGAQRIHLVDLDAAFGEPPQARLREFALAWPSVRFQLGGGLRSREAVLRAQADGFDTVVGTLALEAPGELRGLDPTRIIAALDLRHGAPVVRGWTKSSALSLEAVAAPLKDLGVNLALVTDVERDGAMTGPGVEALAQVAALGFRVQASGGLRDLDDLALLAGVAESAISGKAMLDGAMLPEDPAVRAAMAAPEGVD